MSFITGTQAELLYTLASPVTKNTYTTEAVMSALAGAPRAKVRAAFWDQDSGGNTTGKALWGHVEGTAATTSAATLQMRLGFDTAAGTIANAVTVWPTTAPTAAITCLWTLDFWYTAQSVGGSTGLILQCNTTFEMSAVAAGLVGTANQRVKNQVNLTGMSSEADSFIELFGTWSASAAGNTTTIQQFDLFGLN